MAKDSPGAQAEVQTTVRDAQDLSLGLDKLHHDVRYTVSVSAVSFAGWVSVELHSYAVVCCDQFGPD